MSLGRIEQLMTLNDNSKIVKSMKFVIIVSNIGVALLVGATAAMRYIFKTDLYGIDEFVLLFAFTLYMSGSAYGAHQGKHITADILSQYIKNPKLNSLVMAFSAFLTVLLSGVFTWLGAKMFIWQIMKQGKTQIWRIPLYLPQGIIFIGLTLMTLYFVIWFLIRVKECKASFAS